MKKNNVPIGLIIASVLLIVFNFIDSWNEMDKGFWMRIISSLLLIIAMALTIKNNKNETRK